MFTSAKTRVHGRHRRAVARRSRTLLSSTTAVLALVGASVATPVAPAQAADNIVIGASGDVSGLEAKVGTPIARHLYGKLSGPTRVAALVNIETTVNWSQVANGSQDANIKRWAAALKGKDIMVSFSHEPMAKQNIHFGSDSDFIAAWKRMVSVFNNQGSTSVKWVWNVTSHSFKVKSSDVRYGPKWYPGDSYVDYVAGEAYNRYGCGEPERSFASRIAEILVFAQAHNKKFVTAEFSSHAYAGRAAWISAAHAFMDSRKGQFAGAFYYNPSSGGACNWHLNTSAEFAAVRTMVSDAGFGA